MSTYFKLQDDILNLFEDGFAKTGIDKFVTVNFIGVSDQKTVTKVIKNNPLNRYKSGDDVDVIVNEYVFDRIPEELKNIVIEETLARIAYDYENDKLVVKQPDFESTFSLLLQKYGFEEIVRVRESIKSIYSEKAELESAK